jgi:hypothetical protein
MGGNRTDLTKAAEDGAKKKAVLGAKAAYLFDDQLGEPVTIAAALASAAPIIVKFKDILKQAGISDEDITKAATSAVNNFKAKTGVDLKKTIFKQEGGITASKSQITANDLGEPTEAEAERVVKTALVNSTGLTDIPGGGTEQKAGSNVMAWIKNNPILAAAGAYVIYKAVK